MSDKVFKLMLDPGHAEMGNPYYGDYGKQGITEGRQMWKLSGYIMDYVKKHFKNVQVGRTKKILNSNPALATRGKMAAGHDCFLSLHTNAGPTVKRGTYMYYAVGDKDGSSRRLAIFLADEIGDKIFGHADDLSREIARLHPTMKNRSYYGVLRAAEATDVKEAIMCELGYHTNNADLKTIATDSGLKKIASVLCESLAQWYGWLKEEQSAIIGGGVSPGGTYTVQRGDTLWSIAMRILGAGARYKEIMTFNGLKDSVNVFPGQVLKIPGGTPSPAPKPSVPVALQKALLKHGARGELVYILQHALNVQSDAKLVLDGSFGPATLAAVRNYQRKVGITSTGEVDSRTWDAIVRCGK